MANDLSALIPEWECEAELFEQKAQALRQMIEAVRVLNGDAARLFAVEDGSSRRVNQFRVEDGPRGREAVRRITSERRGEWAVRDIKRINRERGWPSSDAALETAVARLAAKGEAISIRKGVYRFGAEAPDEAVTYEGGAASELTLASDLVP